MAHSAFAAANAETIDWSAALKGADWLHVSGVTPAVNQVELHPLFPQEELRQAHAQLGVATEAWAPLGQGALLLRHVEHAVVRRQQDAGDEQRRQIPVVEPRPSPGLRRM